MVKEVLFDGFFQTWEIGAFDEIGFPIVLGHGPNAAGFGGKMGSPWEVEEVICLSVHHATVGETAEAGVCLSGGEVVDPAVLLAYAEPEPAWHKLPETGYYSG